MSTARRSNGENAALVAAPGAAAAAERCRGTRALPLHSLLRSLLAPALLLLLLHLGDAGAAGDNVGDWSPLEAGHGNWSAKQLKKNAKKLKSHDAVMVGFSGASCGDYCRQFEPVYAEFTAFLSAELPAIKFIRLDADKHKAIMAQYARPFKRCPLVQRHPVVLIQRLNGWSRYGVSTLPEIITIKKGHKSSVPYAGVHSQWALRSFARKLAAPPIVQLKTEAEVSV
jgi:hypothetical protein